MLHNIWIFSSLALETLMPCAMGHASSSDFLGMHTQQTLVIFLSVLYILFITDTISTSTSVAPLLSVVVVDCLWTLSSTLLHPTPHRHRIVLCTAS